MKKLIASTALVALFGGLLPASAAEPIQVPPAFRCTSCGAQYQVKTKVNKDNAIQIKLERVAAAANPKNS
jgi:hypothetical protein